MFRCWRCVAVMDYLAPPAGARPRDIEAMYARLRKALSRAIWDQDAPRGRGRTLDGLIWIDRVPGPRGGLDDGHEVLERTRAWLGHLAEEGISSEAELLRHVGGREDELGVDYPPDMEALLHAFRAVEQRLRPGARAEPTSNESAYAAIAKARRMTPDAVRKAVSVAPRTPLPPDRTIVLLSQPAVPGAPCIRLDIEELERRHPGAWEKLTRRPR